MALERGEKLSALSMKSEALTEAASQYAKNAQALAAKYKKKSEWFWPHEVLVYYFNYQLDI